MEFDLHPGKGTTQRPAPQIFRLTDITNHRYKEIPTFVSVTKPLLNEINKIDRHT